MQIIHSVVVPLVSSSNSEITSGAPSHACDCGCAQLVQLNLDPSKAFLVIGLTYILRATYGSKNIIT